MRECLSDARDEQRTVTGIVERVQCAKVGMDN